MTPEEAVKLVNDLVRAEVAVTRAASESAYHRLCNAEREAALELISTLIGRPATKQEVDAALIV